MTSYRNTQRTNGFSRMSDPKFANALKIKTVMCSNLPNCRFGSRCRFAHSQEEIRRTRCAFDDDVCNLFLEGKCPFDHSIPLPKIEEFTVSIPHKRKYDEFIIEIASSDDEDDEDDDEPIAAPTDDEGRKMFEVLQRTREMFGMSPIMAC